MFALLCFCVATEFSVNKDLYIKHCDVNIRVKISDNASFFSVAVRICSRSSYLLGSIDIFA